MIKILYYQPLTIRHPALFTIYHLPACISYAESIAGRPFTIYHTSMQVNHFSLFKKIGIDLGTSRVRIWHEKKGLIIDEPSCIAIDQRAKKIVAVGQEASLMEGRVSDHIKIFYPIKSGFIDDFEIAKSFLQVLLEKALPHSYFFRPIVMTSVPALAQETDRTILTDLLYQVGAREVYLISQPLAAAIGADVPIADASGSLILNLGAGTVEGSMISFGNCVSTKSTNSAGNFFDQQIQKEIKTKLKLKIGIEKAEQLKHSLISLRGKQREQLVSGQDLVSLAPKEIIVSNKILHDLSEEIAGRYVKLMQDLLCEIPPELTSDLIDKGILLTGGMAELDGLDLYLVQKMGVPVSVVDKSANCVIKGIATVLEHLDLFKESLGYLDQ